MRRNDHAPALKNHWQKCYREEEGPALPLLPVPAQALALFQALRAATHPPRCFWGGYRDPLRSLDISVDPSSPLVAGSSLGRIMRKWLLMETPLAALKQQKCTVICDIKWTWVPLLLTWWLTVDYYMVDKTSGCRGEITYSGEQMDSKTFLLLEKVMATTCLYKRMIVLFWCQYSGWYSASCHNSLVVSTTNCQLVLPGGEPHGLEAELQPRIHDGPLKGSLGSTDWCSCL